MTLINVSVLVEPGFVPTELALVQDVLRIANRFGQGIRFDIGLYSTAGTDLIEGLGGVLVRVEALPMDTSPLPDHLVVLGGKGIGERFEFLRPRLRWYERMGRNIILMSDASAAWRRLHPDAEEITTHWEDEQVQVAATREHRGRLPLYAQSGRIATAAGMVSVADVVLGLIVAPVSVRLAQAVGNILLLDRIRGSAAEQPRSENDVNALRLVRLERTIAAMEANLEDPLSMVELAEIAGLSIRQFERKFKSCLGQTPSAFYRSLRLRRAKRLIEQTTMPITEIGVACGFGTPSSFSKNFTREFGFSPARLRGQLSAVATSSHHIHNSQGSRHASVSFSPYSSRPFAHAPGADEALVQGTGG